MNDCKRYSRSSQREPQPAQRVVTHASRCTRQHQQGDNPIGYHLSRQLWTSVFCLVLLCACQGATDSASVDSTSTAPAPAASTDAQHQSHRPSDGGDRAIVDGDPGAVSTQAATQVRDKRRLTDFALTDHNNQPFNRDRLLGQWTLLFFGFTRCPDICPPTLTQLVAAQQALTRDPHASPTAPIQIVFVSVDPDVDTPAVMARYVAGFNAAGADNGVKPITGVTGDKRQIRGLAAQLGVHYSVSVNHLHHQPDTTDVPDTHSHTPRSEQGSDEPSQVDHSGTVLVLDPRAYLHAVFAPPLPPPSTMLDDLSRLTGRRASRDTANNAKTTQAR